MPIALTETETETSISEEELAQRVAVVRRFKELLVQQRDRFRNYLAVLDRQQLLIGYGSADEITAHVELEEQIVADIFSIQKVLDPLEVMYNATSTAADPYLPANDVPALKASLEELKTQAAVRAGQNRDLLSSRMEEISTEIQVIKDKSFFLNARFLTYQDTAPSLVDIMG